MFADGESYLQFKKSTPVKHSKAKHNKTRYACVLLFFSPNHSHLSLNVHMQSKEKNKEIIF